MPDTQKGKKKVKLKAYTFKRWDDEYYPAIVYAYTKREAAKIAKTYLECTHQEMWGARIKWADNLKRYYSVPDFKDDGVVAVLRAHGWSDPNIYSDPCRRCKLFPWNLLPLSKLSAGVCGYCHLSYTI